MRVIRPLVWLVLAGAALAGFVALGAWNETPVRWGDLSGWLDEVTLESALVEVARWLGIVLALYVIVVAALVLLSELAALVHAVPAARLLHGAARAFAVPALRRRLATASTATAITVSALSVQGGVGLAAAPAAEVTVDAPATTADASVRPETWTLPAGVDPADVTGFDLVPAPEPGPASPATGIVEDGDTLWGRITAHYGYCDAALIELVRSASGIEDPNVIYTGQTLVFPALDAPTPEPPTPVAAGESTWSLHTIVAGDTLWDILESHYGFVSGDLVWAITAYNGLADPSDIPIGTIITLPPLDAAGVPIPESVPAAPSRSRGWSGVDAGAASPGGGRRGAGAAGTGGSRGPQRRPRRANVGNARPPLQTMRRLPCRRRRRHRRVIVDDGPRCVDDTSGGR